MSRTLAALLGDVAVELATAGFAEPRRHARRVLAAALDLAPAKQLADPQRLLDAAACSRSRAVLDRVLAHEPLSRILGRREFWGLDFGLSAATLDPRPDSETLVEAVLQHLPDRSAPLRLLDLGAGSGCLLIALLSELPAANGVGVDIAEEAARTARSNAAALGFAGRASFLVGDWGAALAGRFDVIVANPPYIATAAIAELPPEVVRYDPRRALDGGPDGLDPYRAIAADLPRLLKPGGIFAGEIGLGQAGATVAILRASGFGMETVARDLAGIARCLVARPGGRQDGVPDALLTRK